MTSYFNINYSALTNEQALNELKKQNRQQATKLHPDAGGNEEEFKVMYKEFETLFNKIKNQYNKVVRETQQGHEKTETPEVYADIINALIRYDDLIIELCGTWIWISGNTKEHKEVLKANKCRWAKNKEMWYFRLEEYASHNRRTSTMDDIRARYASL